MEATDLPVFQHLPEGERLDRNIRDGYARGWGLQFGDLREKIAADPLYKEALRLASGRTVQSEDNRMNLFLLLKFYMDGLAPGHVVEFGSFRGGSAIFMARLCAEWHPEMQVFALDTFAGMPETDRSIDAHSQGDFSGVDLDELRSYSYSIGLRNLQFVEGLFEDTAPGVMAQAGAIRLAHIDCDIRSAVQYSYDISRSHMVKGGYIAFDDALFSSCLGATEVVEEKVIRRDGLNSEQIYPHFVFRAP
ncbi:MAG: TylF/MycF/NovP-related O-methyltransferase [Pseudomonadota bacterium]